MRFTERHTRILGIAAILLSTAAHAEMDVFVPPAADWTRHPIIDMERTGSITKAPRSFLRLGSMDPNASGVLVPIFRRLATDARQLRFEGENGVSDLPVYVSHDQLTEPAKLKIKYLSSISVMPEASRLTVSVNEKHVATIVLDASAEPGTAEVELPANLLQFGYNVVRLTIEQRHRVDCSIEAANELWTQIDPAGSGLALTSTNDQITSIEEIVGMPVAEDGSVPITVVLPGSASLNLIDQALRSVQALAIRADIYKPRVRFTREAPTTNGIHLYVGTRLTLSDMGLDHNALGDGNLAVTGRISSVAKVVVSGDTDDELNTTIIRLSADARVNGRRGTEAGLRALAYQHGAAIRQSNEISLSAFGLASQEFSGRVFRSHMNLVLPSDFYPADNGKALIFLDGSYVAGLLNSNEAIVRVNGRVVGASRLTRGNGEDFNKRAIEIALSSLQPGHNAITLEIRTARSDDRDCNPLSLIEGQKRLTLSESTSFALPRVAQAEFLPNLGGLAASAFPFRKRDGEVAVYLPKADTASLAAAATVLTRIAIAAGKPVLARTTLKAPDEKVADAIIVGSIGDIPESLVNQMKVPARIVPPTWKNVIARAKSGSDKAPAANPQAVGLFPIAAVTGSKPQVEQKPAAAPADQKPEEKQQAAMDYVDRSVVAVSQFLQRNVGYTAEQLSFLNSGRTIVTMPDTATLLMAQTQSPAGNDHTWLMLAGRSPEELVEDASHLVSPHTWRQIHGRMIAYDPTTTEITRFPVGDDDYIRVKERSLSNITLFAAGWLSNHIEYYVLLLVTVCAAFGIFSRKLLNRIGAQP